MKNLEIGKHYLVKHGDKNRYTRRFFKYTEKRFNSITCFVFSSRVSEKVSVKYNGEEKSFTMTAPYGTPTPAPRNIYPYL